MLSAWAGSGRPVSGPGMTSNGAPLIEPAKSYSDWPSGRYSKPAMNSAGSSPLITATGQDLPLSQYFRAMMAPCRPGWSNWMVTRFLEWTWMR